MTWRIVRDPQTGLVDTAFGDEFPPASQGVHKGTRFLRLDLALEYSWDGNNWTVVGGGGLPGTITVGEADGVPTVVSVDTLIVDQADGFVLTDLGDGDARLDLFAVPEAVLSLNFPTHSNALDHSNANDPTAGEKAALAGTSGVPGAANKYVTDGDARNSNARTPTAHAASHQNAGGDEISVAGLSGLLADGQTPLAHASSHQAGGGDIVKLDDLGTPDDNTDLDASITVHGLLRKLNNNAATYLDGTGAFSAPSAAPAPDQDAQIYGLLALMGF